MLNKYFNKISQKTFFLLAIFLAGFFGNNINAQVANDACANAVSLAVNPDFLCGAVTNGTIAGATDSGLDAPPEDNTICFGTEDDDVWYSFVATGATHSVDLINITGGTTDLYHSVWSGACGALTNLNCSDPNNSIVSGLTAGDTYYVRVYSWTGTAGQTSVFDICIGTPPPPPANDACANAVSLTVNPDFLCGAATTGTIASATDSGLDTPPEDNTICGGTEDDDVWYSFVATGATHSVDLINITGSTTDLYHSVWSGACGALTNLNCSDPNNSIVSGLTIGDTYYVRVYSWTGTAGQTSVFDICIGTPPPPPINDDCANAVSLTVNLDQLCGSVTSGTIASATDSGTDTPPEDNTICGGTEDDDVWYSFVATGTTHSIDLINITGSTTDLYHSVWSGTCGALTNLNCSDPNNSIVSGLTIGDTYYLRVYSWTATAGQTSVFDVCIGTPPAAPANDFCANAIAIATNPDQLCGSVTSGTIASATDSGTDTPPEDNTICGGTEDDDVWFTFVATATTHTVDLLNITGSTTDLYHSVWSGACGALTNLNCSDPNNSVVGGLTIGDTYYVRVYSWTATVGQTSVFDICIGALGAPPANDDCANAEILAVDVFGSCPANEIIVDNLSATTSVLIPSCGFSTTFGDVFYEVVVPASGGLLISTTTNSGTTPEVTIYDDCAGTTELFCDASVVNETITGLPAGATVYVQILQDTRGNYSFCIQEAAPLPVNDEAEDAIPLCAGESLAATNGSATVGIQEPGVPSCIGSLENTVWFSFESTAAGDPIDLTITEDGCEIGIQTVIFEGPIGGPYTEIDCNAVGPVYTLSIPAPTPNTNYFLYIDGNAGAECIFTIDITGSQLCCGPDYELVTFCELGMQDVYYVELNILDIGDNPSGYAVNIDGNAQPDITAAGTFTYGPFTNAVDANVIITGLDDGTCIIDQTLGGDCSCESQAIDAGIDVEINAGESADLEAVLGATSLGAIFIDYTVTESAVDCTLLPTGPVTNLPLGDDQVEGPIALPTSIFPNGFSFFDNVYTDIYVSSNGFVTFDPTAGSGCCTGQSIPAFGGIEDFIALFWEDLTGTGGTIDYFESGNAFVIEYDIPHLSGGNNVDGQIIIYDDGTIVINCISCASDAGTHTSGIENSDGTLGYFNSTLTNGQTTVALTGCTTFTPNYESPFCDFIGWYTDLNDTMNSLISTNLTVTVTPTTTTDYYAVTQCGDKACVDTVTVVYNNIAIMDPCTCLDNESSPNSGDGQFSEYIQINSGFSETWTVTALSNADGSNPGGGFYDPSSTVGNLIPFPSGVTFTNGLLDGIDNDGDGSTDEADEGQYYTLSGIHVDLLGYSISVENEDGITASIGNTCQYSGILRVKLGNALYVNPNTAPNQNCIFTWYKVEASGALTVVQGPSNVGSYNPTEIGTYAVEKVCDDGVASSCRNFEVDEIVDCADCD